MEYKVLISEPVEIVGRVVTGFAAITGNVDSGGDRIVKGAFKKTIRENGKRVRHLWMHDPFAPPTAAIKELNEVGVDDLPEGVQKEYPEATGGLMVVREYLESERGEEVLEGIRKGAIKEMSFGYDAVKWEMEPAEKNLTTDYAATLTDYTDGKRLVDAEGSVRNLKEVRLWDTSDVTWGMNQATVASKAGLRPVLEGWKRGLAEAGNASAEAIGVVEELMGVVEGLVGALVQGEKSMWSAWRIGQLQVAMEELERVLLAAEPHDEEKLIALTEQVQRRFLIAEREFEFLGLGG